MAKLPGGEITGNRLWSIMPAILGPIYNQDTAPGPGRYPLSESLGSLRWPRRLLRQKRLIVIELCIRLSV